MSYRLLMSLLVGMAVPALTGCKDEKPKVYSAPPDPPLAVDSGVPGDSATGPATAPPTGSPRRPAAPPWTVPAGWMDKPDPTGVRQASYSVTRGDRMLDIAVTAFPGATGGELENVNRWRRELTLPEIADDGLNGLAQPVKIGGENGQLYEFANTTARADGNPAKRTLVAQLPAGGMTVFFKMHGDATLAAEERPNFLAWLASVQTGPEPSADTAQNRAPAAPVPAAGAPPNMRGPVAAPPNTSLPKWTPPAHWQPAGEKPMRLASFDIPGDGGTKGDLSISALGGGAGGLLANVNRWRVQQLGLPAWDDAALAKESEKLQLGNDVGTLVDLKGADKRILAVIVPRGDRTWFYKLTAPDALVSKERENFVNFVKSARY